MSGSLSLGKIAGTRIEVHMSWLVILALLLLSLANDWFPTLVPGLSTPAAWAVSGLAVFLLFASILAHELTHALVARLRGFTIESITLFAFGGVSDLEQEPKSAEVEFQMALVGPFTNLAIGASAALAGFLVGANAPLLAATLNFLAVTNLLLTLFNLIPGLPLDGGRLLRSLLWEKTGKVGRATYWAALIGQIAAYLFILVGIWQIFGGSVLLGIWLGFIGWFMLQADTMERAQDQMDALFRKTSIRAVMRPIPLSVPPYLSLQELVDIYLLPRGLRTVAVVEDEQLLGLISLSGIRQIAREQWKQTRVEQAMLPLAQLHTASPEQSLSNALALMVSHDVNQLPVVESNHIVGMVSREDILHLLETRRTPGLPRTPAQSVVLVPAVAEEDTPPERPAELAGSSRSQQRNE